MRAEQRDQDKTKAGYAMARASNYAQNRTAIVEQLAEAETHHSLAPTVRDLATAMNVGVATVHSYLRRLAMEGMVEWTPNKHRSLRLTDTGRTLIAQEAAVARPAPASSR
jgi:Mn-dependent DtxR family transcriptional regulator